MNLDDTTREWHKDAKLPEPLRQSLIEKQLGQLRPTPPPRALYRLAVAGSTLLMLGLTTTLWYRGHYVLPPIPTYKLEEPKPNGYQTAIAACQLEVKELNGIMTSPSSKVPQPLAGRKKLVAANATSIAKLREALGQAWLSPRLSSSVQTYPELARFREEARMVSLLAARTYAEQGNFAEAAQCATDAIDLGVKVPRGGVLISGLVGVACEAIGEKSLWEITDKLDAKTARATVTRLLALETKRTSYAEILDEERRFNQLGTRRLFAGGPVGAWKELSKEFDPFAENQPEGFRVETEPPKLSERLQFAWLKARAIYYGPRTTIEAMDYWMKALAVRSEQPWQANRSLPPLPDDPLSQMVAPVFAQSEFRWVQVRVSRMLLITYLALHAYRMEKGHVAPSLEALVHDGYLSEVPRDPFSPTRAPLGYRNGKLWSVGPDAKDDRGTPIDMKERKSYLEVSQQGDFVARVNTW